MFREKIIQVLVKQTKLKKEEVADLIEVPPSLDMGDYAFPCFLLSKKLKKSPDKVAEQLADKLKLPKDIEKVEVKGPYLNFFINKSKFAEHIISIDNSFGKQKQNQRILLEHTSVNPNASPHVGRIRNSIIGDSIYRMLVFMGNKVERHYYVNDVSKQIAMLALVFKSTDKFEDLLDKYVDVTKKLEKDPSLEKKIFELLHKFEHKDKQTVSLFNKIVSTAIDGQKKVFSSIGIEFDYWDYESKYIEHGKQILKDLEKTGKLVEDHEGRMVLDLKTTPIVRKMKVPVMVLTRSDHTGLYHFTIEKGKKGRNIIVLGEDQKLYFEQLCEALKMLKKPCPEVVHYSFVLLKGGGKMQTRRGEVVLLTEFLNSALEKAQAGIKKRKTKGDPVKVAIAAVKYSMLRNDNNKNIIFDLEQSLSFEGNTGPYLQYSYARASSIIKKAKRKKKLIIPKDLMKEELQLLFQINKFPDKVDSAAKLMNPSIIANYSHDLAKSFNEFYHSCKVIGSKEESFRLRLIGSFRIVLKNSLWLLGIDVMEEM